MLFLPSLSSGYWRSRVKGKSLISCHASRGWGQGLQTTLPLQVLPGGRGQKGGLSGEHSELRPEVQWGDFSEPGIGPSVEYVWGWARALCSPNYDFPMIIPTRLVSLPFFIFPIALITTDTVLHMDLFAYCFSRTTM